MQENKDLHWEPLGIHPRLSKLSQFTTQSLQVRSLFCASVFLWFFIFCKVGADLYFLCCMCFSWCMFVFFVSLIGVPILTSWRHALWQKAYLNNCRCNKRDRLLNRLLRCTEWNLELVRVELSVSSCSFYFRCDSWDRCIPNRSWALPISCLLRHPRKRMLGDGCHASRP